ncbi:MAG: EcsC family protein [Peptostreptococcaceae bacterium]|nr:EcsC family protein [Peptostreptococcaceae bacterium]
MKEFIIDENLKIEKALYKYSKLKKDKSFFKNKIKIKDNKIIEEFTNVFASSFYSIFIEEKFKINEIKLEEIKRRYKSYEVDKNFSLIKYKNITNDSKKLRNSKNLICTCEGIFVGFMGITTVIADIPVFLKIINDLILQIKNSYGFSYDDEFEKYIKIKFLQFYFIKDIKILNEIFYILENRDYIKKFDLKEEVFSCAKLIANSIFVARSIQSIPVAGSLVGGVYNLKTIKDIGTIADLIYKKRFINDVYYNEYKKYIKII